MNPPSQTIRVAVVEDCLDEREKIVVLLNSSPGFVCAAACVSAEEALRILHGSTPDIVLMDIRLPGQSGIDCIPQLKAALPKTQIMMLTIFEDHERIFQSLAAGATSYMLKRTPAPKLLEAIQELHDGGAPMSGQIARQVVAFFQPCADKPPAPTNLSPVEQRILRLLARGFLYKEVASELNITTSTVRTHIWHIYTKLQVHNRTQAVLKGLPRRGM